MSSTQGAGAAGGPLWRLPSGDSGGVESEPSGQWWPGSPSPQGPGSPPLGRGVPVRGLTTGLVGAAAVWAPHLHQDSAHDTLYVGTAEALTHCMGREAGDTSATDTLELESSETHWLRRGTS